MKDRNGKEHDESNGQYTSMTSTPAELKRADEITGESTIESTKDIKAQEQKEYEAKGIKGQIKENLSRINKTDCLFEVSDAEITDNYDAAVKTVQAKLDKTKGFVRRDGFGEIQVSARLTKAKAYLKTVAEKTAVLAVPTVIEKGIDIGSHDNHKSRGYPTYTFAGRVTISGKAGIVAVVIKKTTGNFYKVHRIMDSNGQTLDIEKTTD